MPSSGSFNGGIVHRDTSMGNEAHGYQQAHDADSLNNGSHKYGAKDAEAQYL